MLTVKRDGTKAVLAVTLPVPFYEDRVFSMIFDAYYVEYSSFLCSAIDLALRDALKKARKDAYEQGYKDAKAKRRKETWFSSRI